MENIITGSVLTGTDLGNDPDNEYTRDEMSFNAFNEEVHLVL